MLLCAESALTVRQRLTMSRDRSHTLQQEIGSRESPSENLGDLTLFDAFANVHTPPECLPPVRVRRAPLPYEESGRYMREAFRAAISALGLEKVVPPERLTFSGAVPSPDVLRQYEKVLPNATARIFSIAERELELCANRQASAFEDERRKINSALWTGLALLAAAGVAVWHGNAYIALSLGLAGPVFALFRCVLRHQQEHPRSKRSR